MCEFQNYYIQSSALFIHVNTAAMNQYKISKLRPIYLEVIYSLKILFSVIAALQTYKRTPIFGPV